MNNHDERHGFDDAGICIVACIGMLCLIGFIYAVAEVLL